jgi:hypothetical protein
MYLVALLLPIQTLKVRIEHVLVGDKQNIIAPTIAADLFLGELGIFGCHSI